jgi:hypothetical protein
MESRAAQKIVEANKLRDKQTFAVSNFIILAAV